MFNASMKFDLGDDVNALREMVHRWAQERVKPMAADIDLKNEFPPALWEEMGSLGLLGMTVEEEFGGSAMGYVAHTVAVEEIARASASVSLSYGAHSNLCVNQIRLNGTPEQKAKFLPGLCSGEHVGALAMSEPSAGSDVVSMKLRAEKRNDHYRLSGNKYWITNGPDADTLVVYAKTDPDAGSKGITAFLIEKSMKGFTTGPHFDKLGMRGSNTAELIFDDVEVPFENVLGEEGRGVRVLMSGLDYERVVLAGIGLGIVVSLFMRDSIDLTVARDRNPTFVVLSDGSIRNGYTIKVANQNQEPHDFVLSFRSDLPLTAEIQGLEWLEFEVEADKLRQMRLFLTTLPFARPTERAEVEIWIEDLETRERVAVDTFFLAPEPGDWGP